MTVRRSGGFAGLTRTGTADLGDASQPDVRALVDAVRTASAAAPEGGADRYVYHVRFGDDDELTVHETALPADVRARVEGALDG